MSVELHPLAASPDPSAPPLIGFLPGSNRPYLVFSAGGTESCVWTFRMPSITTPEVKVQWSRDSGAPASQSATWRVNIMAVTPGAGEDVHADSYDVDNEASSQEGATLGHLSETTITLLNTNNAAIGDYVALKLTRIGSGVTDSVRMHAATLELG